MDSKLNPAEVKLLKELITKQAYEVAKLKQAEVDGHLGFPGDYFQSRQFLNALLVLEMQEAMIHSVEEMMDKYEDTMGPDTMYYVLASTGLQYFAAMTGALMETSPLMAEQLLDEVMIHYDDLCEEAGIVEVLNKLSDLQDNPEQTPTQQLKTALTLVKGNKEDE